jgi:two-component sensor histidine kinase
VLEIRVRDNGVGLPEGFDIKHTSTVGIPLVNHIVRKQLQGSVHYENRNGLRWRITLREDVYTERV